MNCEKCGKDLEANSVYCNNCGYKVENTYRDENWEDEYSILAIIGFLIGIFSIVNVSISGFILSIVGIVFSKMGIKEIDEKGKKGYILGKAGFIISIISIVLKIIIFAIFLLFLIGIFSGPIGINYDYI